MGFVKQTTYEKKMTDMMENVKVCWAQFREQALDLSYERQRVMNERQLDMKRLIKTSMIAQGMMLDSSVVCLLDTNKNLLSF